MMEERSTKHSSVSDKQMEHRDLQKSPSLAYHQKVTPSASSKSVSSKSFSSAKMLQAFKLRLKTILMLMTVEPVMLLDGMCHWSMQTFMEIVQMQKTCEVGLNYTDKICRNLTAYPEENLLIEKEYSLFVFQNSIVMSVLPLIIVLFLGAWSDKYGRKIPLLLSSITRVLWSGGYFLNSWQSWWPIEIIYIVTLCDALGGSAQGLVTSSVAYISDVTPKESRTSRVSIAMSLWYFGGPVGNFIGAFAIQTGGINLALSIVFVLHLSCFIYIAYYIKESHGPFKSIQSGDELSKDDEGTIKREDVTVCGMICDFFNWRRFAETFKTAFRQREGYSRPILFAVVLSNMVRRAARAFFMYMFVRRTLEWDAALYGYWTSYRTLIAASGSLILVPILTRLISITDPMLIVIGSLSLMGEYCCYGFVSSIATGFFMWLGPPAGLISNASIIAQKSLATKLVSSTEKGRVSALMSATQSLMPMVGYAMYTTIFHSTGETFPEAQFFFAAAQVTLIMIIFLAVHLTSISQAMEAADPEKIKEIEKPSSIMETKPKVEQKLSLESKPSSKIYSEPEFIEKSSTKKSEINKKSSEVSENETTADNSKHARENFISDAEILASENVHSAENDQAESNYIREADQRDKRK